jgi:FkbM family methyltransferase
VPYLFEQLKVTYENKRSLNDITFLNIAVSDVDGTIELYSPSTKNNLSSFSKWITQISSVNEKHIRSHTDCSNIELDKYVCKCFTLNTIIKYNNIKVIDYLYVDTEGHDYNILMNLNLDDVIINNIIFENTHTDGPFTRGIKYVQLLQKFIEKHGYIISNQNNDDTHLTKK